MITLAETASYLLVSLDDFLSILAMSSLFIGSLLTSCCFFCLLHFSWNLCGIDFVFVISFCIRSAITVKCLHVTSFLSESWHQWHLGDVFMTLSSVNHSLWSLLADNQTTRVTAVSSPRDCLRMFWIGKNTGKEWGVREGYIHRRVDRCGGYSG